ncbi:unnamed protein product, partial [Brassica oleracea]
ECLSICSRLSPFLLLLIQVFLPFTIIIISSQFLKCLSSPVGWHDLTALNHSDRFVN